VDPDPFGDLDPDPHPLKIGSASASTKNPDPDPHQRNKLDPIPDPHQFAYDTPKCMEYELQFSTFQGFEHLIGSIRMKSRIRIRIKNPHP
jgi:hypothetical protein